MGRTFGVGEYKTREGRDAVVLEVNPEPQEANDALIGRIKERHGWSVFWWHIDGREYRSRESENDLVPPPREWWLNVYEKETPLAFRTREQADVFASEERIECIRVREVIE